jgi:3-methyl-2-oxobutanoate hydroxymethyltransferase
MNKRVMINDLLSKKASGKKITVLTAYDYLMAQYVDQAGIDIVLVGDSLGNVFAGQENTLSVTMDHMVYHTSAVVRACKHAMVIADMPFLSYQVSQAQAKENAGRLLKEAGAQAVKIEINEAMLDTVKAILDMGVAVMGHVGFTPQSVHQLGGYKVQGRSEKDVDRMLKLTKKIEEIGCFSVVLEMVPKNVAQKITQQLAIPTIGIGAGKECDGQVLVTQDLLGMNNGFTPKFVKKYAQLSDTISDAIGQYKNDVENGDFPNDEFSFK